MKIAVVFCTHTLSCLLIGVLPLLAADTPPDSEGQQAATEVLAGHSYHGEAFNEGPRQRAYLMEGLGGIEFPVTTESEEAQRFINQGVAQLHGFWYFEAERSFRQAAAFDPDCAMAYWGMALANQNNVERARGFIAEAAERKEKASLREQKYIDALADYASADTKKKKERDQKYTDALEKLLYEFPDDVEAKALLALQLWKNASSGLAIGSHLAVDALLEQVFAVNPMHPAHHYRIHLWDREKPEKALESAARCGQSLPAIAHMWHMPGHIYSRLKRYHDAAWQQEASARVDHAHMMRDLVLPDQIHNFAHNNEWLIRNLNYVGRVRDAIDLAKNMIELPRHPQYNVLDKRGSTHYGRLRLFGTLSTFELWDELTELAYGIHLEPTEDEEEQIKRLRHLARAAWRSGDDEQGRTHLAALRERLDATRCERAEEIAKAAEKEQEAEATAASETAEDADPEKSQGDPPEDETKESKPEASETPDNSERDAPPSPTASENDEPPLTQAQKDAAKKYDERIRMLEQAIDEAEGLQAVAAEDYAVALEKLKTAKDVDPMYLARVQMLAGETEQALESAEKHVTGHANEVQPLALYTQLLWNAGKKTEAQTQFEALRGISHAIDRCSPVFAPLDAIAADLGLPADWRLPDEPQSDVGQRPTLGELGPFRWEPMPAPSWTLNDSQNRTYSSKDYQGQPLLVIFYLGYGCLHCAEQLHAFAPHVDAFNQVGLQVAAISTDDVQGLELSIAAYEGGPLPFPLLSDSSLEVFRKYRAYDDFESQPLHGTFLIDTAGRIRWQDISYEPFMDPEFVLREAQRLLAQSP